MHKYRMDKQHLTGILAELKSLKADLSDLRAKLDNPLTEGVDIATFQRKYDEFNRRLFNNELPRIPITYKKLSKVSARVLANVHFDNDTMRRLGRGTVVPGSMRMEVSNVYDHPDEKWDALLIHEMIHVYFNAQGNVKEGHGIRFRAMARKLGAIVGFEIPLVDEVTALAPTNGPVRPLGVIMVRSSRGYSFLILSEKAARDGVDIIRERAESMVKTGWAQRVGLFVITSALWTKFSSGVSVARAFTPKSKFYIFPKDITEAGVPDLMENGEILLDISNAP